MQPRNPRIPFVLRLLPMAILSVLVGCGGDDAPSAQKHLGDGYVHFALPAAERVESLYAVMLSQPERNFDEIKVSGGGAAIYNVQAASDELFLFYAKDLDDAAQQAAQAAGVDVDTSQGDPGVALGVLLVTAEEINRGGLSFNLLSDYISRTLDEYAEQQSTQRLKHYRDEIAKTLLKQDLNGDGVIGFYDALVFDPAEATHRQALVFDYDEFMAKPVRNDLSLSQIYSTHPELIGEALSNAFANFDLFELPPADNPSVHVVEVDTNFGGAIAVDEYPQDLIKNDNQRRIYKLQNTGDGGVNILTLRAYPDEGWRFMNWVDCPQVNQDQSCTVGADQDRHVSAFFDNDEHTNPDVLAPGVAGLLRLGDFAQGDYVYEVSDAGAVLVHSIKSAELAQRLSMLGEGYVIASAQWLCCTKSQRDAFPQTPDGFTPRTPSQDTQVA